MALSNKRLKLASGLCVWALTHVSVEPSFLANVHLSDIHYQSISKVHLKGLASTW